jgi:hypothetical protein
MNPLAREVARHQKVKKRATFEFDSRRLHFDSPLSAPTAVAALAEELRGRVEFAWGPEVMDYGMYEFGIQDPDGYYLAFTEPDGE